MKKNGFSIIEILVAIGIFAVIATAVVPAIIQTFTMARLGDNETNATLYAQEGIEAARSIKNQAFTNLVNGNYGTATGSGVWAFSGTSNTKDLYTRQINVATVSRDSSGNISAPGCANLADSSTKQVTSTVTWNSSPTRSNNVTLQAYFTNWRKTAFGNWGTPLLDTSINLATNDDGIRVTGQGNYIYLIRNNGSPNLYIYDISGLTPSLVGSLTLATNPTNLFLSGRYLYVSNSNNSIEMQIVDVCTPSTPSIVGNFNATRNADGLGVTVSGNYAYLVRANSPDNEFIAINVSTPASPTLVGSLNLGEAGNEVIVMGGYAYVASNDNSQELKVINISTPATPTLAGSLNLGGNNNAISINGFGTTIAIGRIGGEFDTISVSTPATPTLLGTYSAGNNINEIVLGNANLYVFIGTSNNTSEFQVVDISTLSTPVLLGSFNYSADINGVYYSPYNDRVYAASASNTEELGVFKPS